MKATEILKEFKKLTKILFVVWFITFIGLIISVIYNIYLSQDIGIITDEYTQELNDIEQINDSVISNGGDISWAR